MIGDNSSITNSDDTCKNHPLLSENLSNSLAGIQYREPNMGKTVRLWKLVRAIDHHLMQQAKWNFNYTTVSYYFTSSNSLSLCFTCHKQ